MGISLAVAIESLWNVPLFPPKLLKVLSRLEYAIVRVLTL
jgi:hypothetical protein